MSMPPSFLPPFLLADTSSLTSTRVTLAMDTFPAPRHTTFTAQFRLPEASSGGIFRAVTAPNHLERAQQCAALIERLGGNDRLEKDTAAEILASAGGCCAFLTHNTMCPDCSAKQGRRCPQIPLYTGYRCCHCRRRRRYRGLSRLMFGGQRRSVHCVRHRTPGCPPHSDHLRLCRCCHDTVLRIRSRERRPSCDRGNQVATTSMEP